MKERGGLKEKGRCRSDETLSTDLKTSSQVRLRWGRWGVGGKMIHAAARPLLGGTYSARLYSLT